MGIIRLGFNHREVSLAQLQEECYAGWAEIIARLVHDLFELGWNGEVLQVKEKFGGLRFYISQSKDIFESCIDRASHESYRTCEMCGKPGKARSGGWIKTLCDEHAEGREPHPNFTDEGKDI